MSTSPTLSFTSNRRNDIFGSQKRRRIDGDSETTYFNEVLSEAGVSLQFENNRNVINKEQALVIRDVSKILQTHISYPANTQEFIKGFKKFSKKEECFRNALLPTIFKKNDTALEIQQDSLVRILLNVFCVQNDIIEILLKHVAECAIEENNDTISIRLLLNPLRFLAHINNAKMLTTKLVDILDIASFVVQLEILNLIPEIIPDTEYEETAKQLSKLLDDNADLTGAIIDCLNSLNLSPEVRGDIQEQVLSLLDTTSAVKIFPILFEFVVSECNSKDMQSVLIQVRNALDVVLSQQSNEKNADSNRAVIYDKLQTLTKVRKSLFDGWITMVSNVRCNTQVKPIDIQILFMLHAIGESRHSNIELLIRKRVKLGLFKVTHLESLFQSYFVTQVLADYLDSMLQIASSLIRSYNEPVLIEFSETIFKCLFSHQLITKVQQQDIIYNLTLLSGMSDKKGVRAVLKVLLLLSEDFEKMQQFAVQLMGLLEKLEGIHLSDVKLIFQLLCSLLCGERSIESLSGLSDEIHMIIRKLLSSSKKVTKHRGIVAAIVMIKTLVYTTNDVNESGDVDDSILIEDLPTGGPREAATLLELTNTSTMGRPESVGLLYDELSEMIRTSPNIYQSYMVWLYQMFTNKFQNVFVIEEVPPSINDLDLSMQFCLNVEEDVETPIAINIAELTLKSQFYEHTSILILAPLFRLLRLIHYKQHEGNISSIDALLGCPVILPALNDIAMYDSDQLKNVMDCIFHCINWFRESINAFVTQRDRALRYKVLERVSDIVKLQEILEECLEIIPDHKLPSSYFDTLSQETKQFSSNVNAKTSKAKKKQKTSDATINVNESTASTSTDTQKPKTKVTKKKRDHNVKREFNFRALDTDILLLLRYPLKVDGDVSVASTQISESQLVTINLNQFQFLMSDLVYKLSSLMKGKDLENPYINTIKVEDLITDCVKLLRCIKKHFRTITAGLKELIESGDGCFDSEQMYTNYAKQLKAAFYIVTECYSLIFGWSGFQQSKNLNLLKDCLKALLEEEHSHLISSKAIILEFTNSFLKNMEYCLTLPAAVKLINILQALYAINANTELKKIIAVNSRELLSRKWYNDKKAPETGKEAFLCIDELVKGYLTNATPKTICGLIGTLQEQVLELNTKDDSLQMLPSINKTNFYIFYRNLCVTLLKIVRTEIASLTNNEHLNLWKFTGLSMQGLMTVVKAHETKTNLISYLKNCIGILKVFLSHGIPILEILLQTKATEVLEIFKIIQASTRFSHHICCYSKSKKDLSLVSYVPQFRQVLESLLYRVKATLVANGCSDAFWMGTLKNKNLHGEDILSQSTIVTDTNTEDSENNEQLPSDDEDVEEVDSDDSSHSDEI